jgi:hypothetical protein
VTDHAGLPDWVNANSAVWFDYDRDGRIDPSRGLLARGHRSVAPQDHTDHAESFEYAKNGGRKYLFQPR